MKASNFKFIAWDSEDKKFVRSVSENQIPTVNTKYGFKLKSKFELFLWTGYVASNGKEIYDGHILKVYTPWHFSDDDNILATVEFVDGIFKFKPPINQSETVKTIIDLWKKKELNYEIIGHIETHKI